MTASEYTFNAGVALIYGKTVLLGKRALLYDGVPMKFPGYWSIFAGALEGEESPMTCAVREVEEETQIKINITDLRYIKTIDGEGYEIAFYVCEMDYLPSPVLDGEHTECGWFDINLLENISGKIDPKIVECIDIYRRMKNNEYNHSTEDDS